MNANLRKLSDRIGELIEASPYAAADIARSLNVDRSSVARWISGDRTPTIQNLLDLAELLGVMVEDFWLERPLAIPAEERRDVLECLDKMSTEQRRALIAFLRSIAQKDPANA